MDEETTGRTGADRDGEQPEQDNGDEVSKDELFSGMVKEAGGFYQLVIAITSAFLGGTLIFLKDVEITNSYTLWFLGLGWVSLVVTIAVMAKVRLMNLKSFKFSLLKEWGKSAEIDRENEKRTLFLLNLLAFGLLMLTIFGFLTILSRTNNKKESDLPTNIIQNSNVLIDNFDTIRSPQVVPEDFQNAGQKRSE